MNKVNIDPEKMKKVGKAASSFWGKIKNWPLLNCILVVTSLWMILPFLFSMVQGTSVNEVDSLIGELAKKQIEIGEVKILLEKFKTTNKFDLTSEQRKSVFAIAQHDRNRIQQVFHFLIYDVPLFVFFMVLGVILGRRGYAKQSSAVDSEESSLLPDTRSFNPPTQAPEDPAEIDSAPSSYQYDSYMDRIEQNSVAANPGPEPGSLIMSDASLLDVASFHDQMTSYLDKSKEISKEFELNGEYSLRKLQKSTSQNDYS